MLNRPVQLGRVAQMGERGVRNAEVEGSIPFSSTKPHPKQSVGIRYSLIINLLQFLGRLSPPNHFA